MKRVFVYSALLLAGMALSQTTLLVSWLPWLHAATKLCLAYIMIEVGLEFSADVKHPRTYAMDAGVALAASCLPWILCALYFMIVFGTRGKEALLVACFAAPTSAGVLFTMLAAAGLGSTWLFKKARVLAIFDDLSTILLLIPLQLLLLGWRPELMMVILLTIALLFVGYRWINRSGWPVGKPWLVIYGIILVVLCRGLESFTQVHLEVLLPAFVLGCVLRHQAIEEGDDPHSFLDQGMKGGFLLLVGCALPKVGWSELNLLSLAEHVVALTVLSNIGKCFPLLCYREQASPRQRLALSVAMFPRGEVGAGVLLMSISYGITGIPIVLGSLSLALNLFLTGLFIAIAVKLTSPADAEGDGEDLRSVS